MIRATIVLLVAHLVIPRLRTRSAAERHLLWTGAFAMAAMLPLLGAVLPAWQPGWAQRVIDAWPPLLSARSWTSTPDPDVVVRATGLDNAWTLAQWSLIVWSVGALVALLLFVRDVVRLVPLVRSSREADAHVRSAANRVATAMRVSAAPRFIELDGAVMPMTWGIVKPVVLVPAGEFNSTIAQRLDVLRHELAHVRQVERHGLIGFLVRYVSEYARNYARMRNGAAAYSAISFEIEARAAEELDSETGL